MSEKQSRNSYNNKEFTIFHLNPLREFGARMVKWRQTAYAGNQWTHWKVREILGGGLEFPEI